MTATYTPSNESHTGLVGRIILLASDARWCGTIRENLSCVSTRQDRATTSCQPPRTPNDTGETIGKYFHGLYHLLPKSEGCGSIIVMVDRFFKYTTFIPAPVDCTVEETTKLFFKNVVKYWGVPQVIVNDWDPRFTGRFWTELFRLMRSDLNLSTSFHP